MDIAVVDRVAEEMDVTVLDQSNIRKKGKKHQKLEEFQGESIWRGGGGVTRTCEIICINI